MTILTLAAAIAAAILVASLTAVVRRVLGGPSAADRVIGLDMLGLVAICLAGLVAVLAGHPAFLDIALGIALFGFLGAVAFAGLLERASTPVPGADE